MDGWALLALAGLGAHHGVNPAMGWLFAVALGMQERDRRAVLRALVPIAIGHELALASVVVLVLGLGADSSAIHSVPGSRSCCSAPSASRARARTRVGRRSASPGAS